MDEAKNEITTSPLPQKTEVAKETNDAQPVVEMNFPDAIKEVINGKKIFRLEWVDKAYYGFLNETVLSLHKPDGKNHQWIISSGDLQGEDWIVI